MQPVQWKGLRIKGLGRMAVCGEGILDKLHGVLCVYSVQYGRTSVHYAVCTVWRGQTAIKLPPILHTHHWTIQHCPAFSAVSQCIAPDCSAVEAYSARPGSSERVSIGPCYFLHWNGWNCWSCWSWYSTGHFVNPDRPGTVQWSRP